MLSSFLEPIAADNPLGADANVVTEEALHCSFADIEATHHVIYPGDLPVRYDAINDLVNHDYMLISLWKPLAQELLHKGDHRCFILLREDCLFKHGMLDAKSSEDADGSISQRRDRF